MVEPDAALTDVALDATLGLAMDVVVLDAVFGVVALEEALDMTLVDALM